MITNTKVARELATSISQTKTSLMLYDVDKLADDRIVVLCRFSGESLAGALARMANGEHKSLSIRPPGHQ